MVARDIVYICICDRSLEGNICINSTIKPSRMVTLIVYATNTIIIKEGFPLVKIVWIVAEFLVILC